MSKTKKIIIWIVIGVVAATALTLGLVFGLRKNEETVVPVPQPVDSGETPSSEENSEKVEVKKLASVFSYESYKNSQNASTNIYSYEFDKDEEIVDVYGNVFLTEDGSGKFYYYNTAAQTEAERRIDLSSYHIKSAEIVATNYILVDSEEQNYASGNYTFHGLMYVDGADVRFAFPGVNYFSTGNKGTNMPDSTYDYLVTDNYLFRFKIDAKNDANQLVSVDAINRGGFETNDGFVFKDERIDLGSVYDCVIYDNYFSLIGKNETAIYDLSNNNEIKRIVSLDNTFTETDDYEKAGCIFGEKEQDNIELKLYIKNLENVLRGEFGGLLFIDRNNYDNDTATTLFYDINKGEFVTDVFSNELEFVDSSNGYLILSNSKLNYVFDSDFNNIFMYKKDCGTISFALDSYFVTSEGYLIDYDGNAVALPEGLTIYPLTYNDGLFLASKDLMNGYVNAKFETVIPFEYDRLTGLYDGYAIGEVDGEYYRLSKTGHREKIDNFVDNSVVSFAESMTFYNSGMYVGRIDEDNVKVYKYNGDAISDNTDDISISTGLNTSVLSLICGDNEVVIKRNYDDLTGKSYNSEKSNSYTIDNTIFAVRKIIHMGKWIWNNSNEHYNIINEGLSYTNFNNGGAANNYGYENGTTTGSYPEGVMGQIIITTYYNLNGQQSEETTAPIIFQNSEEISVTSGAFGGLDKNSNKTLVNSNYNAIGGKYDFNIVVSESSSGSTDNMTISLSSRDVTRGGAAFKYEISRCDTHVIAYGIDSYSDYARQSDDNYIVKNGTDYARGSSLGRNKEKLSYNTSNKNITCNLFPSGKGDQSWSGWAFWVAPINVHLYVRITEENFGAYYASNNNGTISEQWKTTIGKTVPGTDVVALTSEPEKIDSNTVLIGYTNGTVSQYGTPGNANVPSLYLGTGSEVTKTNGGIILREKYTGMTKNNKVVTLHAVYKRTITYYKGDGYTGTIYYYFSSNKLGAEAGDLETILGMGINLNPNPNELTFLGWYNGDTKYNKLTSNTPTSLYARYTLGTTQENYSEVLGYYSDLKTLIVDGVIYSYDSEHEYYVSGADNKYKFKIIDGNKYQLLEEDDSLIIEFTYAANYTSTDGSTGFYDGTKNLTIIKKTRNPGYYIGLFETNSGNSATNVFQINGSTLTINDKEYTGNGSGTYTNNGAAITVSISKGSDKHTYNINGQEIILNDDFSGIVFNDTTISNRTTSYTYDNMTYQLTNTDSENTVLIKDSSGSVLLYIKISGSEDSKVVTAYGTSIDITGTMNCTVVDGNIYLTGSKLEVITEEGKIRYNLDGQDVLTVQENSSITYAGTTYNYISGVGYVSGDVLSLTYTDENNIIVTNVNGSEPPLFELKRETGENNSTIDTISYNGKTYKKSGEYYYRDAQGLVTEQNRQIIEANGKAYIFNGSKYVAGVEELANPNDYIATNAMEWETNGKTFLVSYTNSGLNNAYLKNASNVFMLLEGYDYYSLYDNEKYVGYVLIDGQLIKLDVNSESFEIEKEIEYHVALETSNEYIVTTRETEKEVTKFANTNDYSNLITLTEVNGEYVLTKINGVDVKYTIIKNGNELEVKVLNNDGTYTNYLTLVYDNDEYSVTEYQGTTIVEGYQVDTTDSDGTTNIVVNAYNNSNDSYDIHVATIVVNGDICRVTKIEDADVDDISLYRVVISGEVIEVYAAETSISEDYTSHIITINDEDVTKVNNINVAYNLTYDGNAFLVKVLSGVEEYTDFVHLTKSGNNLIVDKVYNTDIDSDKYMVTFDGSNLKIEVNMGAYYATLLEASVETIVNYTLTKYNGNAVTNDTYVRNNEGKIVIYGSNEDPDSGDIVSSPIVTIDFNNSEGKIVSGYNSSTMERRFIVDSDYGFVIGGSISDKTISNSFIAYFKDSVDKVVSEHKEITLEGNNYKLIVSNIDVVNRKFNLIIDGSDFSYENGLVLATEKIIRTDNSFKLGDFEVFSYTKPGTSVTGFTFEGAGYYRYKETDYYIADGAGVMTLEKVSSSITGVKLTTKDTQDEDKDILKVVDDTITLSDVSYKNVSGNIYTDKKFISQSGNDYTITSVSGAETTYSVISPSDVNAKLKEVKFTGAENTIKFVYNNDGLKSITNNNVTLVEFVGGTDKYAFSATSVNIKNSEGKNSKIKKTSGDTNNINFTSASGDYYTFNYTNGLISSIQYKKVSEDAVNFLIVNGGLGAPGSTITYSGKTYNVTNKTNLYFEYKNGSETLRISKESAQIYTGTLALGSIDLAVSEAKIEFQVTGETSFELKFTSEPNSYTPHYKSNSASFYMIGAQFYAKYNGGHSTNEEGDSVISGGIPNFETQNANSYSAMDINNLVSKSEQIPIIVKYTSYHAIRPAVSVSATAIFTDQDTVGNKSNKHDNYSDQNILYISQGVYTAPSDLSGLTTIDNNILDTVFSPATTDGNGANSFATSGDTRLVWITPDEMSYVFTIDLTIGTTKRLVFGWNRETGKLTGTITGFAASEVYSFKQDGYDVLVKIINNKNVAILVKQLSVSMRVDVAFELKHFKQQFKDNASYNESLSVNQTSYTYKAAGARTVDETMLGTKVTEFSFVNDYNSDFTGCLDIPYIGATGANQLAKYYVSTIKITTPTISKTITIIYDNGSYYVGETNISGAGYDEINGTFKLKDILSDTSLSNDEKITLSQAKIDGVNAGRFSVTISHATQPYIIEFELASKQLTIYNLNTNSEAPETVGNTPDYEAKFNDSNKNYVSRIEVYYGSYEEGDPSIIYYLATRDQQGKYHYLDKNGNVQKVTIAKKTSNYVFYVSSAPGIAEYFDVSLTAGEKVNSVTVARNSAVLKNDVYIKAYYTNAYKVILKEKNPDTGDILNNVTDSIASITVGGKYFDKDNSISSSFVVFTDASSDTITLTTKNNYYPYGNSGDNYVKSEPVTINSNEFTTIRFGVNPPSEPKIGVVIKDDTGTPILSQYCNITVKNKSTNIVIGFDSTTTNKLSAGTSYTFTIRITDLGYEFYNSDPTITGISYGRDGGNYVIEFDYTPDNDDGEKTIVINMKKKVVDINVYDVTGEHLLGTCKFETNNGSVSVKYKAYGAAEYGDLRIGNLPSENDLELESLILSNDATKKFVARSGNNYYVPTMSGELTFSDIVIFAESGNHLIANFVAPIINLDLITYLNNDRVYINSPVAEYQFVDGKHTFKIEKNILSIFNDPNYILNVEYGDTTLYNNTTLSSFENGDYYIITTEATITVNKNTKYSLYLYFSGRSITYYIHYANDVEDAVPGEVSYGDNINIPDVTVFNIDGYKLLGFKYNTTDQFASKGVSTGTISEIPFAELKNYINTEDDNNWYVNIYPYYSQDYINFNVNGVSSFQIKSDNSGKGIAVSDLESIIAQILNTNKASFSKYGKILSALKYNNQLAFTVGKNIDDFVVTVAKGVDKLFKDATSSHVWVNGDKASAYNLTAEYTDDIYNIELIINNGGPTNITTFGISDVNVFYNENTIASNTKIYNAIKSSLVDSDENKYVRRVKIQYIDENEDEQTEVLMELTFDPFTQEIDEENIKYITKLSAYDVINSAGSTTKKYVSDGKVTLIIDAEDITNNLVYFTVPGYYVVHESGSMNKSAFIKEEYVNDVGNSAYLAYYKTDNTDNYVVCDNDELTGIIDNLIGDNYGWQIDDQAKISIADLYDYLKNKNGKHVQPRYIGESSEIGVNVNFYVWNNDLEDYEFYSTTQLESLGSDYRFSYPNIQNSAGYLNVDKSYFIYGWELNTSAPTSHIYSDGVNRFIVSSSNIFTCTDYVNSHGNNEDINVYALYSELKFEVVKDLNDAIYTATVNLPRSYKYQKYKSSDVVWYVSDKDHYEYENLNQVEVFTGETLFASTITYYYRTNSAHLFAVIFNKDTGSVLYELKVDDKDNYKSANLQVSEEDKVISNKGHYSSYNPDEISIGLTYSEYTNLCNLKATNYVNYITTQNVLKHIVGNLEERISDTNDANYIYYILGLKVGSEYIFAIDDVSYSKCNMYDSVDKSFTISVTAEKLTITSEWFKKLNDRDLNGIKFEGIENPITIDRTNGKFEISGISGFVDFNNITFHIVNSLGTNIVTYTAVTTWNNSEKTYKTTKTVTTIDDVTLYSATTNSQDYNKAFYDWDETPTYSSYSYYTYKIRLPQYVNSSKYYGVWVAFTKNVSPTSSTANSYAYAISDGSGVSTNYGVNNFKSFDESNPFRVNIDGKGGQQISIKCVNPKLRVAFMIFDKNGNFVERSNIAKFDESNYGHSIIYNYDYVWSSGTVEIKTGKILFIPKTYVYKLYASNDARRIVTNISVEYADWYVKAYTEGWFSSYCYRVEKDEDTLDADSELSRSVYGHYLPIKLGDSDETYNTILYTCGTGTNSIVLFAPPASDSRRSIDLTAEQLSSLRSTGGSGDFVFIDQIYRKERILLIFSRNVFDHYEYKTMTMTDTSTEKWVGHYRGTITS